jgi:hypothetical protein
MGDDSMPVRIATSDRLNRALAVPSGIPRHAATSGTDMPAK